MDARTHKPVQRILLSNDDGIDAIGLKILYDIAVQFSDDVWVIAPSENRSGASRSITLRRDVAIKQIGPKRYSCSGTPADCIIFGMSQILDQPCDRVGTVCNCGAICGSARGMSLEGRPMAMRQNALARARAWCGSGSGAHVLGCHGS